MINNLLLNNLNTYKTILYKILHNFINITFNTKILINININKNHPLQKYLIILKLKHSLYSLLITNSIPIQIILIHITNKLIQINIKLILLTNKLILNINTKLILNIITKSHKIIKLTPCLTRL